MKKLLILSLAVTLAFTFGCSNSSSNDTSTGSDIQVIDVPGNEGCQYAELALSFGSIGGRSLSGAITRNAGDWSGTIEISGENMTGTYTATIFRDDIANGNAVLRLPLGLKIVNMTISYERSDGIVDSYVGTGNLVVAEGDNTLDITMSQVATGGTVSITGQNLRYIHVTLIEKNGGRLITGASITFSLSGTPVKTVVITEAAQTVYLPVQAEFVSEISEPYSYEIFHPEYLILTGTLKISMNQFEADGEVLQQEHEYVNFQRLLDEDIEAPTINTVIYPAPAWDSNGDFTIDVNAVDNRELVSVTGVVNGNTADGTTVNGVDYSLAIPLAWLNYGDNTITITATDASDNQTTVTRTLTRSDDINPTFNLPSAGLWDSPILLVGLVQPVFNLDFQVNDNYQIATVSGAANVSGNTYRIVLDPNLPDCSYATTVTATDTYGNSHSFTCHYSVWKTFGLIGTFWVYQGHISYSFTY